METGNVLSRIEHGCRVSGCHDGSTVVVGADKHEVIRLCLRHAKAWSNSDLCRDYAANGHKNSLRVLAKWISLKSQTEAVWSLPTPSTRPLSGSRGLLASAAR
jgi:hypothetical protein